MRKLIGGALVLLGGASQDTERAKTERPVVTTKVVSTASLKARKAELAVQKKAHAQAILAQLGVTQKKSLGPFLQEVLQSDDPQLQDARRYLITTQACFDAVHAQDDDAKKTELAGYLKTTQNNYEQIAAQHLAVKRNALSHDEKQWIDEKINWLSVYLRALAENEWKANRLTYAMWKHVIELLGGDWASKEMFNKSVIAKEIARNGGFSVLSGALKYYLSLPQDALVESTVQDDDDGAATTQTGAEPHDSVGRATCALARMTLTADDDDDSD